MAQSNYQYVGDKDPEEFKRTFAPRLPSMPKVSPALGWSILFAPWNQDDGPNIYETIISFVLEFFWSFVLGFAVTSARRYTGATGGLQAGFFIGVTHAAVFLMAFIWSNDYGLKRHMNWAVSVARFFKFFYGFKQTDFGLIALLFYMGLQLAGAAAGGGFLKAWGLGSIPNTLPGDIAGLSQAVAPSAQYFAGGFSTWFIEFLGTGLVVLAIVYNDLLHQKKYDRSSTRAKETEYENNLRVGTIGALALVVVTTMFYPMGSYSFGQVPYFAGLVGLGNPINSYSNPAGTLFLRDWAHYLFTPLAAGAVFGIVAYLIAWFQEMATNAGADVTSMQRRQYVSSRHATPLTERLMTDNVRVRTPGSGDLKVNAFN